MTLDAQRGLVLFNANVVTLDAARPRASVVGARDGRITHVGERVVLEQAREAGLAPLDCQGSTLLPGFQDAHMHLLGLASRLLAVDCTPCRSMDALAETIRRAAATTMGRWLRAWGYHESQLKERRHPTRRDLDAALPDRPVRLAHRSGHAHVLNSAALREVGITETSPDPPGGVIERDKRGAPTGVLFEMDAWLDGRVPSLTDAELGRGVRLASRLLVERGVTCFHDATPSNSLERWRLFQHIHAEGMVAPRCVFMPGLAHLPSFLDAGLGYGAGDGTLRVGPAKAVLTLTTGALHPPRDELLERVRRAHLAGFPVALHAVEAEAVAAAAEVLLMVQQERPRPDLRHRIEHASECPPEVLDLVRRSGAVVVTNPGFVHHSGDRYLAEAPHAMLPWLYRVGSLHHAGATVAFGSDAPVELPDPLLETSAAVTRRSSSGALVGPDEAVDVETALRMHTRGGAFAAGMEREVGAIAPGMLADLVLLDGDPREREPAALRERHVTMTLVGGKVAFRR
ncbi:MAG: amidohydrolase [Dehalococcoidia bacterium]|nr:amidohydrolase [Dehalococcoidia bacterium]